MLKESEDKTQAMQSLSALVDGELDAAATMLACAHWRGDVATRSAWHAYHLIGDVMRSDELASDAARDAGFLRAVRQRLADEPVPLAPQPTDPPVPSRQASAVRNPRWSWMAPTAVAAGFMAVASVLVVTRGGAPLAGAADSLAQVWAGKATLASAPLPADGRGSMAGADAPVEPLTLLADGKLVRDARLDRYFAAHKQFGGSSALGVPSGFLRAATAQTPER